MATRSKCPEVQQAAPAPDVDAAPCASYALLKKILKFV